MGYREGWMGYREGWMEYREKVGRDIERGFREKVGAYKERRLAI